MSDIDINVEIFQVLTKHGIAPKHYPVQLATCLVVANASSMQEANDTTREETRGRLMDYAEKVRLLVLADGNTLPKA